jgi:hypothetical protein
MKSIDKIHKYIMHKDISMILVVNNNSKMLMNALCNSIYNKYTLHKSIITSNKGLKNKLGKQIEKLLRVDIDLNKIQFGSSTNRNRIYTDFSELKLNVIENCSKLLFKTDISLHKEYMNFSDPWYRFPLEYVFDLIILIDTEDIKIVKRLNHKSEIFNLEPLTRSVKLKQIQNRLKLY